MEAVTAPWQEGDWSVLFSGPVMRSVKIGENQERLDSNSEAQ